MSRDDSVEAAVCCFLGMGAITALGVGYWIGEWPGLITVVVILVAGAWSLR